MWSFHVITQRYVNYTQDSYKEINRLKFMITTHKEPAKSKMMRHDTKNYNVKYQ